MSAQVIPFTVLRSSRRLSTPRPLLAVGLDMTAAEMKAIIAAGGTVEMIIAAKEAEEAAERVKADAEAAVRRSKERERKQRYRRRLSPPVPQCPAGHEGHPNEGTPEGGVPSSPRQRAPAARGGGRQQRVAQAAVAAVRTVAIGPDNPFLPILSDRWCETDPATDQPRPHRKPSCPRDRDGGWSFPEAWIERLREKRAVA